MRKNVVGVLALAMAAGAASAQQVTFTQWRFNNYPTGQIINSPLPSTGTGTAVPLGQTNNYLYFTSPQRTGSYTTCDVTSSGASGDTGAPNNCWRVRGSYDGTLANAGIGWSIFAPQFTQGAEFDVPTTNYSGVVFSFDWFTTNQGVRHGRIQYSTNGGVTWQNHPTVGVLVSATNGWVNNVTADFTGIANVDDNPNFRVRFVSVYDPSPSYTWTQGGPYTGASGGQYNNNSGNWRFDRVTFKGTAVRSVNPTITGTTTTPAVCSSGGTITFTATPLSGAGPLSTSMVVTGNLSSIGGSATQAFFDDGTNGDATAGDGVFSFTATTPANLAVGTITIPVTVVDAQSRSGSTNVSFVVGDCSGNSASRVVISQVFGGGGNLGVIPAEDAPYDADFVEIYNRTSSVVNMDGWSVQYASQSSSTGFDNTGDRVNLSGNILPGQHMLVRMSDPVQGFFALPTPDFAQLAGLGGMGNQGGRVALVRTTNLLGTNYTRSDIEDFVGYGAGATAFEGSAPTATPSPVNAVATIRKVGGSQDSNQNFNDFSTGTPTPRNRSSGGYLAGYASVDIGAVCTGSNVTFKVKTVPGTGSTGINVHADVTAIAGTAANLSMYDDGTHGDVTANDGIYTLSYNVPASSTQGVYPINFTVADAQGHSDVSALNLAVGQCENSPARVVISQVYGGGGNAASGYNGDFAELFNRSNVPVNLTGWSFQSARVSDAGFDFRIVPLSGIINPGEYRLIVANQLSTTGAVLPAADFVPGIPFGMESSFGRVALVSTTNLLHADYHRADVVDLVGYGTEAQSFEGVAATGTLDDVHLAVRKDSGCQDTNQNATDFDIVLALALPHNSASATHVCANACAADFNGDGSVDFFDYLDFVDAFSTENATADFNGDGSIDFFDYLDFVNAFSIGC